MSRFRLHLSHLLVGLLLLHASSGSALAQPKVEPFEMPRDGRGFIPKQKFQPLNGRVIGVLVGNPTQILTNEGRFGPGNQVCLSVDGYSYRWIYTQVENDNAQIHNLTVPTKTGGNQVFPRLNIASARDVAKWNVVPDALVEVEVNDDKGSPATDSFVATEMRRLDGTRSYPLNVSKVLADSRTQWEKWSKEQVKLIAEKMTEVQKKAIGDRKPNLPRSEQLLQYVTWIPESKRLQVRYLLRVSEGEFQGGPGVGVIVQPGIGLPDIIDQPVLPVEPDVIPPVDPVRPDVIRPIEEIKVRPLPARPIQPRVIQPRVIQPQIEPAPAPKNAQPGKGNVNEERPVAQKDVAPARNLLGKQPLRDQPVPNGPPPVQVDPVPPGAGGGVAQPGVIIGRPGGPAVVQPINTGKTYGVEIGVAFEYSHTGELVRILTLEPQTFVQAQPNIGRPIDDLRRPRPLPLPVVPELPPEGPAIQPPPIRQPVIQPRPIRQPEVERDGPVGPRMIERQPAIQPAPAAPVFLDGVLVPGLQRQPAIQPDR